MISKRSDRYPTRTDASQALVLRPQEEEAIDNHQNEISVDDPAAESDDAETTKGLPSGIAVMIVIVLDISGSVTAYAKSVRDGLARLLKSLQGEITTKVSVDLLLLTFAAEVKAYGFATPDNFQCPSLDFDGRTSMGAAIREAKLRIEGRWREYAEQGVSLNKCMVVVISDGQPTDKYEESFAAMRGFEARFKRVEVFPIAAGDAAHDVLNQLSGVREAVALDTYKWADMFDWIYQSAHIFSASQVGEQADVPTPRGWSKTRKE